MSKIIAQLETLPTKVRDMRALLVKMSEKLEDLSLSIRNWEFAEMQDITEMQDGKGKPLFSNAEKRQYELERRKSDDDYIRALENEYTNLKKDIDANRIDLQFHIDTQENIRAIARLGGE